MTNARGGWSQHNFGLAVDCVPGLRGDDVWRPNWNEQHPDFRAMVSAMVSRDLVWGGNWKSLPDFDHFQASALPVTPDDAMRTLYTQGGLEAVWTAYK